MRFKIPFVLAAALLVTACDPGLPEESAGFQAGGVAAALTQGEFNALPADQQYMVANKLLGTMYRGVAVEDFFDMNAGMSNLAPVNASFLTDTRSAIEREMTPDEVLAVDTIIDGLDEDGNFLTGDVNA